MYNKYLKSEQNKSKLDSECSSSAQINELMSYFNKLKYEENSSKLLSESDVLRFFSSKLSNELETSSNGYEFYDLFCGAGGLSLGIEQNGFRVKKAVEKDLSAVKTYHFNRPHLKFSQIIQDDITKHSEDFELQYAPLIVGGPPCQGFSNANKQKKEQDSRNQLYKFFVKKVKSVNPEIFIMENVTGILKYFNQIQDDFHRIGYSTHSFVLDTADFGFPQNRKRVFIFGYKSKIEHQGVSTVEIFQESLNERLPVHKYNLMDAIGSLPALEAKTIKNATNIESNIWGGTFYRSLVLDDDYSVLLNGEIKTLPVMNHKTKYNNARDIEIYSLLTPGDKSDSDKIAHINPYTSRADIFKDKFFKLEPQKPCKTLTSHMYYDCHMYIHPYQSRGLTPRESARVQGFPDDYLFLGSPNEWYRQIGNAVSPLIANVLGAACKRVLDRLFSV